MVGRADRFSGWLSLFYYPREASCHELVTTLKNYFCTYGVAEQVSSDDGPQFRSNHFRQFLTSWGVNQHRVSSAYHPHSNLGAETAVKSDKRLLLDNTKADGSPQWDKIYQSDDAASKHTGCRVWSVTQSVGFWEANS